MNRINTHAASQLLPVNDIRPGSLVVVTADGKTIARRVGNAQGGTWGTVVKSWHSGHGIVTMIVKHDKATHPTGLQQFTIPATDRYVAKRAL